MYTYDYKWLPYNHLYIVRTSTLINIFNSIDRIFSSLYRKTTNQGSSFSVMMIPTKGE